jgi:L-aspartate oxidase
LNGPHESPRFAPLLAAFDLRTTALLRTDVLVIGSGIAGAAAALAAADDGVEVLLVAKDALDETNTAWAQGGIAAVQAPQDSIAQHLEDTLKVGAGIADERAARAIVERAPDAIRWLERLGTRFDREANDGGSFDLSREGDHSHARLGRGCHK